MPGNAHAESYLAAHPERTRRVPDPHDAVDLAHHSFATLLHTGDQDAVSPGDGEGSAQPSSASRRRTSCVLAAIRAETSQGAP